MEPKKGRQESRPVNYTKFDQSSTRVYGVKGRETRAKMREEAKEKAGDM
jgi:hypothetical protein